MSKKKKKTSKTTSGPAPIAEETQCSPDLGGIIAPILPFREFLQKKSLLPIVVVMDHYREKLKEKSQNIIWKDDLLSRATEAAKLAVEMDLKRLGYPQTDLLLLSLETANPAKMHREYTRYRQWAGNTPLPTSMVQAETIVHGLGGVQVDELVEALATRTELNMQKIKKMLEMALSKIKWHGSHLVVEPQIPVEEGWFRGVETAEVQVNREPAATRFQLTLLPGGLGVQALEHNENFYLDVRLQADYQTLLESLQRPASLPRIMTVYLVAPVAERQSLKESRKELAILGSTSIFANKLSAVREEVFDKDIWKIRVDGRRLIEVAPGEYRPLDEDDLIIRSIELVQEGDA